MGAHHHPDGAWLLDHATKALGRGFDAVIAGHLLHCQECRRELAQAEQFGTRLVESSVEIKPRLSAVSIREAASLESGATCGRLGLSAAAQDLRGFAAAQLGFDWNQLPWRSGTPGLRIAHLADEENEHIWLLHGAAGTTLPEHRHTGAELTLILHGAYVSGPRHYAAGDVDESDESVTHRQVVTRDSDCVCLLVFEGQLKYTGAFGLLQRLLRF